MITTAEAVQGQGTDADGNGGNMLPYIAVAIVAILVVSAGVFLALRKRQ